MISYKLFRDGAFVAGDSETRRTCYAYPGSVHSKNARKHPKEAAMEMMEVENSYELWRDDKRFAKYDAANWKRLKS
jgi:hypothetical protein